jgi:hypothetical protein
VRRGMKNPRGWARHVLAARQTKGPWSRVAGVSRSCSSGFVLSWVMGQCGCGATTSAPSAIPMAGL